MRILVLGAGGFIGRHILADLVAHGHEAIAVARSSRGLKGAFPDVPIIEMDLAQAVTPGDWSMALKGIDAVVNAAGVLRGRDMRPVHVDMPRALYAAAAEVGVSRVVLISAISARPDVATDYAQSKLLGESLLREVDVGWTILRPSLVYGDGSYGGTSLLRGMAALPWGIPVPARGDFPFTPIHAHDLARAVRLACEETRLEGQTLEPVGPETIELAGLLTRYRSWLGFGRARFLSVPMTAMRIMGRLGDIIGDGPIATNSLIQMVAGNGGDSAAFAEAIGFQPRSLGSSLAAHPAQVQDRWHARLFFLAPAIKAVLLLLWLASAWLGAIVGSARTVELVSALGWPAWLADPLRLGSSFFDLLIAALLVLDDTARRSTPAQLIVVLSYSLVIGFALPSLWFDPLGPLLKNMPILALILVHGAVGDKR
jgi:uncharacterized protein YbjT (DUF2867 family)